MNFKRIIAITLLATFTITIGVSTVEASWLSKNWNKLNKALGIDLEGNTSSDSDSSSQQTGTKKKSSVRLPQYSDYSHNYRAGHVIGHLLPNEDMVLVGVSMGATFGDVRRSLGKPSKEGNGKISYGGISYYISFGKGLGIPKDSDRVTGMYITNRDAATARGIAVGDSLERLYAMYHRPDYIGVRNWDGSMGNQEYWFYGRSVWSTDDMSGIEFSHDGEKITRIVYH